MHNRYDKNTVPRQHRPPSSLLAGTISTVVLAVLMSLTGALLTAPAAGAQEDLPPRQHVPMATWNLDGYTADGQALRGELQSIMGHAAILALQESGRDPAGLTPMGNVPAGSIETPDGSPAPTVEHFTLNFGSTSRTNIVHLYRVQTDQGGNRVHLVLVTHQEFERMVWVPNPMTGGQPNSRGALGGLVDNDATFTYHALSGGGNDAASMLAAIDRWANARQTPPGTRTTYRVLGDFNREPRNLDPAAGAIIEPPVVPGTPQPGERPLENLSLAPTRGNQTYDYRVAGPGQPYGTSAAALALPGSDHHAVVFNINPGDIFHDRAGRLLTTAPQPAQNTVIQGIGNMGYATTDELYGILGLNTGSLKKRGDPPPEGLSLGGLTRWLTDHGVPDGDLYTVTIPQNDLIDPIPYSYPPGLQRPAPQPVEEPDHNEAVKRDLRDLVELLLDKNPKGTVVVATLPEISPALADLHVPPHGGAAGGGTPGPLFLPPGLVDNTKRFNKDLPALVRAWQDSGMHVELADSHLVDPDDFKEGNQELTDAGTKKLADSFVTAIKAAREKSRVTTGDAAAEHAPSGGGNQARTSKKGGPAGGDTQPHP